MKFICTQSNFQKGLVKVAALAGRNPQLPVLQHVLIEVREGVLHLTCTDLEVGARVVVSGRADKEGGCTVPARQLLEYVQQLPTTEPLQVELKKGKLLVFTRGFKAQFPVAAADDFPLLPALPNKKTAEVDGTQLRQALEQTVFAAAKDDSRPEIHSIFMRGEGADMRVAATDSFRLAEYVVPLKMAGEFSLLLPVAAAQEISRLFGETKVEMLATDNYIVFKSEGVYLSSRLVEGSYPDYQQIIPSSFESQGEVRRAELTRALKILSVFLRRDLRRVTWRVKATQGVVEMRVEGSEAGEGEVTLEFNGKGGDLEVLFNINYLLDGATHGNSENLQLGFGGSSAPVVFRPGGGPGRSLYIVMPIQA